MGSTLGGFLTGISIMILLLSALAVFLTKSVYVSIYRDIQMYKEEIIQVYNITHSSDYEKIIKEYETLLALFLH